MARRARGIRRRRRPVEWFRTACPAQQAPPFVSVYNATLICDGSFPQIVDHANLIIGDEPYTTQSLTEERKTYTVDRIVGRIQTQLTGSYSVGPSPTYREPGPVWFKWGIYVTEVDENGNDFTLDRYDLFTHGGKEVSWMHRDSWMLGLNLSPGSPPVGAGSPADLAAFMMPDNNVNLAPWGMVDIKVKRHIGQKQRMFIEFAAEPTVGAGAWDYAADPGVVVIWHDLRVLGHWTGK